MHKNANVIQKKTFKRQWSWIKYFLSCCFYFYAFSACQFMGKKGESIDLSTFGYSLHVRDPCIKKSITEKGISCCLCQNYICWHRHTQRERETHGGGWNTKSFKTRWRCKANLPSCMLASDSSGLCRAEKNFKLFLLLLCYCCCCCCCYIATLNKSPLWHKIVYICIYWRIV